MTNVREKKVKFSLLRTFLFETWSTPRFPYSGHRGYFPGEWQKARKLDHSNPLSTKAKNVYICNSTTPLCLYSILYLDLDDI